jgi:uncharacterized membrane protein
MQRRLLAISLVAFVVWMLVPVTSSAAANRAPVGGSTAPAGVNPVSGIYFLTPYPALTVPADQTTTIELTLRNYHQPPQQVRLSAPQLANGWKVTFLGGGQPISAVMVDPDSAAKLQLRLEPPAGAGAGAYHFLVLAQGETAQLRLPITLAIGKELPAKLKLSTNFPALRGTAATSFKFTVTVANDSGKDATINFTATAPRSFEAIFAEAYSSQQITGIPIGAGKSKDVDMSVSMPRDTAAGDYKLIMHAKSEAALAELPLQITIFGQPRLALSGEGGRLSGDAYAGKASPLTVIVRNDGSAAARAIELSATAPDGWKTNFDPKEIAFLPAGKSRSVQVTLIPSARAIAGDYQTTIRADTADGQSESADFRITVLTSTMWGVAGIAIIAIALLVVVFAVARYGRR